MSKQVRRKSDDSHLSTIGEIIAKDKNLKKAYELMLNNEVVIEFYEIFPKLIGIATPEKIEKKILYVAVDYSVLQSELKFYETEIVKMVNDHFKEERIKKVRFHT